MGTKVTYSSTKRKSRFPKWAKALLVLTLLTIGFFAAPKIEDAAASYAACQPMKMHVNNGATFNLDLPLNGEDLDSLRQFKNLSAAVDSVRPRLNHYRELFAYTAWHRGQAIDVVLQEHATTTNDPAEIAHVAKMQHRLYGVLTYLKPTIVTFEGNGADSISFNQLLGEAMAYADAHPELTTGTEFTIGRLRQETMNSMSDDAVLHYMTTHPGVLVIGQEDEPLNHLHMSSLELADSGVPVPLGPIERTRVVRSIVALARLLQVMKTHPGAHGTLVIGFAHAPELAAICSHQGIKATFYNASDEKF